MVEDILVRYDGFDRNVISTAFKNVVSVSRISPNALHY